MELTHETLLLKHDAPAEVYEPKREEELFGLFWGQRKLGIALLDFILHYWDPKEIPKPIFLYVGAAEGDNIAAMARLFPDITWHLYDPREFNIKPTNKIHIYTGDAGWFTDEVAQEWADRQERDNNIFFISDIRNVYPDQNDYYMREKTRVEDMESQRRWCEIIRPVKAHLKFVLPIMSIPGHPAGERFFSYLPGTLRLQPWMRPASAELRLVPDAYDVLVDWDVEKYYAQIRYFNKITRIQRYFVRDAQGTEHRSLPGLDLPRVEAQTVGVAFDISAELLLWVTYLERHNAAATDAAVQALAAFLTKSIKGKKTLSSIVMQMRRRLE